MYVLPERTMTSGWKSAKLKLLPYETRWDDRFILLTPSPLMTGTAQNALACMNDLYHVLFFDPVLTFGVRLIVFLVDVKSGYFTEKTSHVRILPCSSGVPRNSGENTFLGTVWIGDSLASAVQDDEYRVAILVRSNRIAMNGSITIVVITECVAD